MPTVNTSNWYRTQPTGTEITRFDMNDGKSSRTYSNSRGYTSLNFVDSRDTVRTVGYRAKKIAGTLPNNPYSTLISRIEIGASVMNMTLSSGYSNPLNWWKQYTNSYVSPKNSYNFTNAQTLNNVTDFRLYSMLNKHLKGAEWSAPVFIAEARKTGNMVVEAANTAYNVMRNLKKGRFDLAVDALGLAKSKRSLFVKKSYEKGSLKEGKNFVGDGERSTTMSRRLLAKKRAFDRKYLVNPEAAARSGWLQLQYGWKPLFQDVEDAAETLAESVLRAPTKDPIKTKASIKVVVNDKREQITVGYGTATIISQRSHSRRVSVHHYPSKLDSFGSYGLLNVGAVVWELVPLSFVVDWFLPIGQFLASLDVGLRFSFVKGTTGYKCVVAETLVGYVPANGVWNGGNDSWFQLWTGAVPLSAIPLPSILELRPTFDLDGTQILSSLALMSQRLRAPGSSFSKYRT